MRSVPQPPTSDLASENIQQSGFLLYLVVGYYHLAYEVPQSSVFPFSAENSIFIEIPSERRGIELVQLEIASDFKLHALTSRPPLPPGLANLSPVAKWLSVGRFGTCVPPIKRLYPSPRPTLLRNQRLVYFVRTYLPIFISV